MQLTVLIAIHLGAWSVVETPFLQRYEFKSVNTVFAPSGRIASGRENDSVDRRFDGLLPTVFPLPHAPETTAEEIARLERIRRSERLYFRESAKREAILIKYFERTKLSRRDIVDLKRKHSQELLELAKSLKLERIPGITIT